MKYSLMSLMIDQELKIQKPSFIQKIIMRQMGYTGPDPENAEDFFRFMNERGIPAENGSLSFADYVKFAKEHGFDGVDVMSFHFEEEGTEARRILEENGITLSSVNIIAQFGNAVTEEAFDTCFKEVKEVMDRVSAAGGKNVLLMPTGYTPAEGLTREQVFQNMVKGLKAGVEYGSKLGLTVSTETLESIAVPLCSNGEMLRLFEEVPGLKYSHDTGNPAVGMEDPVATYELFKEKVVAVHFKDLEYTEEKTEMMDPLGRYLKRADLGSGIIDFKTQMKALKRDNYQGFITLEGSRPAENLLEGAVRSLEYFKEMEEEF